MDNNIDAINQSQLCNGCGTCYSICPRSAITIQKNARLGILTANIDTNKCTDCGLCREVCHSDDIISGKQRINIDLIGAYNGIYSGYAMDDALRYRASSGGIVSSLLRYLKINNIIDGFVLIKPSTGSPLDYSAFISHDIDDILRYAGTRYFPIPVNMILKELSQMDGKYVIIGTPCQISALRKYEKQDKSISEKIFLRISFFCGGVPNRNAYSYYMKAHGIDEQRVHSIYRGLGWPGNNVFEFDSGETICISRRPKTFFAQIYHTLSFFPIFAQKRCLLCNDRFGVASDISVGDAWLEEYRSDKMGTSLIISRSSTAQKILSTMYCEKVILLQKATEEQLIQSQQIFSDYVSNYPTTCRVLLGRNYFNRHFGTEKPRLNPFWGMKITFINFGMKLTHVKRLWPYLFIYGIIFRYGYQWLSLAEQLMEKVGRHFVMSARK